MSNNDFKKKLIERAFNLAREIIALAKDIMPNNLQEIDILRQEVDELTKILGSSISTLRGKNKL